jgi:hypothetical protein
MTLILVKKFYKNSGKKPARIIFYRDGVSEGQFAEVSVREILAVKRACAKIDPNYKPPITYVSPRTVVFDSAANVQNPGHLRKAPSHSLFPQRQAGRQRSCWHHRRARFRCTE